MVYEKEIKKIEQEKEKVKKNNINSIKGGVTEGGGIIIRKP